MNIEEKGASETPVKPSVHLDAAREQLQRILSAPLFHNSKRLSDMLKYIVDRTLEGQRECLKERIIGIEVFARPLDYDTGVDSIVRVAAAEIRKRLSRYYRESKHSRELRIELPTRSYVAEFKEPEEIVEHRQPVPKLQIVQEKVLSQKQWSIPLNQRVAGFYLWIAVVVLLIVLVGWGTERVFAPTRAMEKFWAPILKNSDEVLIAIGSPIWYKSSPVGTASPSTPERATSLSDFITPQVNFPIADLSAAPAMTSFLARNGKESTSRLSDSTNVSDLRGSPRSVLGIFPNEWALRLGKHLPLQLRREGDVQWSVDTTHPADRRWLVDLQSPYEQIACEYVLINRAIDQTTGQWWIGIGGVTVLGTLAGQQMMIDSKQVADFTSQLPKDWARKNLQIVIEIKMVKGSAGAGRVVASRSW